MTKDEKTKATERTGHKITKGKVKSQALEDKKENVEAVNMNNDKELITSSQDTKIEENEVKKEETKKEASKEKDIKKLARVKKDEAFVNAYNIPMSAKEAAAICKFIKYKQIPKALKDLEEVLKFKKAVPMKGEIPHRKGDIMAGRYPVKAVKNFIILLKSLSSNSVFNDLNDPVIFEAFANIGQRPYGRFGSIRRKRANIYIRAIEKNKLKKLNKRTKFGRKK